MEMRINKDTIKKLRLEKSWSQEKLAEAAGMNLRTMQRIEKDGVGSLRSCASLASALGVEPQELQIGVDAETLPDYSRGTYQQLVPAMAILAVILMAWGITQPVISLYEFSTLQNSLVSFMFLFFAAFVLLAFFTSIVQKRFYILAACVLLGMLMAPPDIIAWLKMAVPLVMLFEFSVLLAKRFGVTDDSFSDAA
ncbi:MAG: helix-turn-helix domain-containing protein [Pseudomonadota bacterium]